MWVIIKRQNKRNIRLPIPIMLATSRIGARIIHRQIAINGENAMSLDELRRALRNLRKTLRRHKGLEIVNAQSAAGEGIVVRL
ncbi:MAG: hypothetical protein FWC95_00915 [Defluviitaleaceae bacterium]|nr:hypothetical protein [Defluviitaleaceae bacterium]